MRKLSVFLMVVVLLALLLPAATLAQPPVPETVGGTAPDRAALPSAGPLPAADGGLLYITSLDTNNPTFAVYDPGTDAWTGLNPFETGCQMAVSSTGQLYGYDVAGWISIYDPSTDGWYYLIDAPPGASGQMCNLEITDEGVLLYTGWNSNTLWHYTSGVWTSVDLPFTANAMGDYDPTTDQYVVGEAWTSNAHLIDVHTWTITDFASPVGNGENARFGSILDNRYYFETGGSNIHSFDLSNNALPPLDSGVNITWYGSSAPDRGSHVVYAASLDGVALWSYDPATNVATPLTGGPSMWHSSLAFTGTGEVDTMHVGEIWGTFRSDPYGRTVLHAWVAVHDAAHFALGDVAVDASIWSPAGGPWARTRMTKSVNGTARFPWGYNGTGAWQLCVDGLTRAGYTYVPGDNDVPDCASWDN